MPRQELMEDIDRIIKQAAIEGTLTEDAIGYYNGLIKLAEEKEAENADLKQQLKRVDEERAQLAGDNQSLRNTIEAWATREADLKDREEKCTRLECQSEYNELRVKDHKEMFATVFKGVHMRRQVVTPGHHGHVDQYGNVNNQQWPEKHDVEDQE